MSKVKLNLVSGSVQEREVVTAFKYNDIKYVIFDGESTGSMGLPIILVCKEVLGKVVGITDAEEWKNTKECLKKIISGDRVEYTNVASELKADDIYYRQLTLPVASFDILKTSYVAPEGSSQSTDTVDNTPVFEQIAPEEVAKSDISSINPVPADSFNNNVENTNSQYNEVISNVAADVPNITESAVPTVNQESPAPVVDTQAPVNIEPAGEVSSASNYDALKSDFLSAAEKLFDDLYNKINHND